MSSYSTSSLDPTSQNESDSEEGRQGRFTAKRKMLRAYHKWFSSYGKPRRNRQKRKSNHVCSSRSSHSSGGVGPPAVESQKILERIRKKKRRIKKRLYVKLLSPSLWEKVVENAENYAVSFRSVSDMTFSTEVLNNLNFNECIGTSLKNFDWGNYLLYILNLIWSLETIKKILNCGQLIKHSKGKVTGIVGLKRSDWLKFFREIDSALEEAQNLQNLIVCSHGIPLESIISSHHLPQNLNWETFLEQSNLLNCAAKNVLDYLLTIFFINDCYITPNSDLTKICLGICEDIPKSENSKVNFKSCDCQKKKKSGVHPIFLNHIKENRSQARVDWIRSKYNIINKRKKKKHKSSEIKNSIEYLTKQKLLSDDKTKTEIINSEKEIKENLFRRQTAHLNLPQNRNLFVENGLLAKIPLHRYVSYLILNLEENERFQKDVPNGPNMDNPIKRLSKKINLKSSFKSDTKGESNIDYKSKIFENLVPARPSVVPRIIQHEAVLPKQSDENVKKVRSSEFVKSSKSAIIYTNRSNERPSVPFSSLPRDHPLVPKAESLKQQLDIPVKKAEPNTDFGKESENEEKPDSIVNYCVYNYGKKNLISPFIENNAVFRLESFLNSGLRRKKLLRIMEEIHIPCCHCNGISDLSDPLISTLIDQRGEQKVCSRLKDYNVLMIKTFKFLYPMSFITAQDRIQMLKINDDLTSHLVSFSDTDVTRDEKNVFANALALVEQRFQEAHRNAQNDAAQSSYWSQ